MVDISDVRFWEHPIQNIQALLLSGNSLSVSYSGGKDSTCILILFLEAMRRLKSDGHPNIPRCVVLNSNTRREMPLIEQYTELSLTQIQMYCSKHRLPIDVHQVQPSLSGRFSWYCIGRGKLPRYVGMSHDCAVNEKIQPMQRFVKKLEAELNVEFISLIGSRVSESNARAISMNKFSLNEVTIVEIDGKRTFAPISNWSTDEVWTLIAGCSKTENREPSIFETYCNDFNELLELYRDANEGVCGVIINEGGNRMACGSRFGCSYCTMSGDRDKSLESMLSENEEKYGFLKPFVLFRSYLIAIRFDLKQRDWRGRKIESGYQKVVPDYFSPHTKRTLLRFLLTMDAMEVERAKKFEALYYANESNIERSDFNRRLCYPMFQNITLDDILAIDFAWSLQRDFREASPAARDWIEIHDLGHRYHIPQIDVSPRVTIPAARWFDVSTLLDQEPIGLKGLIPVGRSLQELEVEFSDELKISEGDGWMYVEAVRDRYFELDLIDPSEVCRAALHHKWVTMRKHDLDRYERIALRHDYIHKMYAQLKPRTVDVDGDDRLMSIHEFMLENSISDDEHQLIVKTQKQEQLISKYEDDLFGIDSILDALEVGTKSGSKDSLVNKKTTSIDCYHQAAGQMSFL